jgi:hypothetical protein
LNTDIILQVKELVRVTSADQRKLAADLWDALRGARKQAEAEKEQVCRPLKQAWESAKKPYDAYIKDCEDAERKLQSVMAAYDLEMRRQAEEEQRKLAAKIEAQNQRRLERAEAKGEVPPPLKPIPIVPPPPKSIETQAGTTQTAVVSVEYGLPGRQDGDNVTAADVPELARACPSLFRLHWPSFKSAAKAGVIPKGLYEERETISYRQRGGEK